LVLAAVAKRRDRLRPQIAAIGLIALLLVFIAAGSSYLVWKNYQDTGAFVRNEAASAAQVVSTNAQWAYETARQILRRVDDSLDPDLTPRDPNAATQLNEAVQALPGSVKIYVVDAAGNTRLTTNPSGSAIDIRDREYYQAVAAGAPWYVSNLMVSRLDDVQVFTIAKRIERDGRFAGVAVFMLSSDFLQDVSRSLNLAPDSTVSLVRQDGELVSRYPLPPGPANISSSVLFSQYLPAARSGTYDVVSPIDGVHRIAGYRRVPGTNLIALSAISTDAAFASLNASTLGILALALPTIAGLILGTSWIVRLLQRDARQREIEEQFETVAEAMPGHVWTATPAGLLDWFNSRVYQYTGEVPGTLDGVAWTRVVHPDDLADASARWSNALASGQDYETEFRLRRNDGAHRWHLSRAVPIRDAGGKLLRWIGTNTDIDDQKQVVNALADSETRLRLAIDAGQLAVWEIDLETLHISPSPALNRLYGFPDDAEPTTEDYLSRYAPGERDRVDTISAALAARGENELEVEVRHLWPDGTEKWLLIRAVLGPLKAIGVAIDITEGKASETALRQSEFQVRLALDAAQMGVWQCVVVDGQFQNLSGDARAIELLGGKPGEPASFADFTARLHPDDRVAIGPAAQRALDPASPGILDLEYRVMARDGQPERWIHARAQTVISTDGLRLIGTVRDITSSKDAEARQLLLSSELQHRIKNILAMVSAISTQTLRGDDIADRREAFRGRLEALSHAHDILTATSWKSASVADVVRGALAPHVSEGRFVVEGPYFPLFANQALSLALTIHELATNAAKYGSLSQDGGTVRISWNADSTHPEGGRAFTFIWQEVGGPLVAQPERRGFGSRMITRVLAADFAGDVRIDYLPAGVVCTLVAPMVRMATPEYQASPLNGPVPAQKVDAHAH